jgi:hypothetical protein
MSDSNGLTAGWYDDPAGTVALRWWDGTAWTTQLRPKQVPPAAVGVGSWILPSPGNGPGSGFSPAAIAAPVQPLAIAASATHYPQTPEPAYAHAAPQQAHAHATPQPNPYGQPAPQPDYDDQPAPQPEYYGQAAPQPDHYGQAAPHPDPFAQLLTPQAPQGPAPTEPAASGPTRSAQTAGIWLLALYPVLVIPIGVLSQWGTDWVLTQLAVSFPPNIIAVAVAIIFGWIFAGADIGRLRKRGYNPPSILWMLLLPPLGYFIARSVALRRDRGKTWPAGIVLGISYAGLAAFVVIMISVLMAVLATLGLLPATLDPNATAEEPQVGSISYSVLSDTLAE